MDYVLLFLCLLNSGVDCITCQAQYRRRYAERPEVQLLRDLHMACPHLVCQQNSCKWQAVISFLHHVMAESEELLILRRQSMETHSGQTGAALPLFNFLPASVPLSPLYSPIHLLSSPLPQSLCCR